MRITYLVYENGQDGGKLRIATKEEWSRIMDENRGLPCDTIAIEPHDLILLAKGTQEPFARLGISVFTNDNLLVANPQTG